MATLQSLTINDIGHLGIPSGETIERPESPSVGNMFFNISTKRMEMYNGSEWKRVNDDPENLLDVSTWTAGSGSVTNFTANGSAAESVRFVAADPYGETTVVWECRPDSVSGADGGWNGAHVPIDNTKKYQFSVWVMRSVLGNGHFYLGCAGLQNTTNIGVLNRSNGAVNTNPYFEVNTSWTKWGTTGVWYQVIGHVWPVGSGTGAVDSRTGIYNSAGTKETSIPIDFVWNANTTNTYLRSYLYYSTNTSTRQRMCYPRIIQVD
jgi:hypothetical protein